MKCWNFGQTKKHCTNPERCRTCSCNHNSDEDCKAPPKCPNCAATNHEAGSISCPARQFRQKVLDTAIQRNVPFQVAKGMFGQIESTQISLSSPSLSNAQTQVATQKVVPGPRVEAEMNAMRRNMDSLQAQLNELKASLQPLLPLAEEIAKNNRKLDSHQKSMEVLSEGLKPLLEPLKAVASLAPVVPRLLAIDQSPPYSPYPQV